MKDNASQIKVQLVLPQDKVSFDEKLKGAWQLIRADKPIGILLLLWPALWSLWIAGEGQPDWYVTLVFIVGSVLVRSAGCAVNDFADRRIDQRVMRTCLRPIATGVIQPREALVIFAVLIASAAMLVLTLNIQTILLSMVAVALALVYPFTKRYTHFPQLVISFAFGWIVPLAFSALGVEFQLQTWLLFVVTMLWVLVYDTEYAMVDRDEDKLIGMRSIAILLGEFDVMAIAIMQVVMIGLLLLVGEMADRSWLYSTGIVLSSAYFVRQQILMSLDKKSGAYAAFLNNNCFGMTIFLLLLADYIYTG